jgi:hypothetical protein
MEHLMYLARRRPYPDCTLYLATAHDIDPGAPADQRVNLDQRRIQAIQNYLAAETAGRHMNFEVVVHDPPEPSLGAVAAQTSIIKMYPSFQGTLGTTGAAPPGVAPAGAAAAPPGGAPAGAPR